MFLVADKAPDVIAVFQYTKHGKCDSKTGFLRRVKVDYSRHHGQGGKGGRRRNPDDCEDHKPDKYSPPRRKGRVNRKGAQRRRNALAAAETGEHRKIMAHDGRKGRTAPYEHIPAEYRTEARARHSFEEVSRQDDERRTPTEGPQGIGGSDIAAAGRPEIDAVPGRYNGPERNRADEIRREDDDQIAHCVLI